MSQAPSIDLNALWRYVTDQVKARVNQPGLWRSLEAARPVTLEDGQLVLGFRVADAQYASLLRDNSHRNTIEQALEQATHTRLRLRVISGETVADWESEKATEAARAQLAEKTRAQEERQTESGQNWDAVGEQLVRHYTALQHKSLPTVQARFLEEAVRVLSDAYPRLMPESPSELEERNFARAMDRVAERIGIPCGIIAYMVLARAGKL